MIEGVTVGYTTGVDDAGDILVDIRVGLLVETEEARVGRLDEDE